MTNSRSTALTALRWLARALALAAAYFVVAKIGLRYATIGPSISPVWPPTGLAVAALVLLGPGYWPAILLGCWLLHTDRGRGNTNRHQGTSAGNPTPR